MTKLELDPNRKRVKYCPCGKKNSDGKFVPFKKFENKGYCHSCGETFFPKSDKNNYVKPNYNYVPPKAISYLTSSLVAKAGRNFKQNNFIQFLKTLFSENEIKEAIKKYLIGTSKYWNGATVFWQIDNHFKIRYGKVMLYDGTTGKRRQDIRPKAHSVSSILKLKNFKIEQCLFGLHLIIENQTKTIALVEGEKTAVIMSLFKPEYVWLATAGVSKFKYKYLKPLKNYNVIAFPDKLKFNDWKNTAIELNRNYGFKIKVSDLLETRPYENYPKETDLADVYINEKKEKLNIQPVVYSTNDKIFTKLVNINPKINSLVKIFDLTDKNGFSLKDMKNI